MTNEGEPGRPAGSAHVPKPGNVRTAGDMTPAELEAFAEAALTYHRYPKPGKLEVVATKNMVDQRDLALA